MKAYRIEDPINKHGLWRDFDGKINPIFSKLTVGKCKDMPMEDNDFYRFNDKQWFSATDKPEKLTAWFDVMDVIEMERLGYKVFEFEILECRKVSNFEICFTRDSILGKRQIGSSKIWKDYEAMRTSDENRRN